MNVYRLVAFIALCLLTTIARAQIAPDKQAEIEKLLRITGMEQMAQQMVSQTFAQLRQDIKNVPEGYWDRVTKKAHGKDIVDMIIPIYDKYYSVDDLKAINAFYSSPAGQRVLSTLPQVMQESMAAGRQWGENIARQAMEESKAASNKPKKK